MALHRINDFDPGYRCRLGTQAIVGYKLYSGARKIGFVDDLVVDESGRFRYLVINPSDWLVGKPVLLPIGQAWIDTNTRQVFIYGLTQEQVKALPAFTDQTIVDASYEAQVRNSYQQLKTESVWPPQVREAAG